VLHFRVDLHRDSAPYRRRAPLESLNGAGPTNSGLVRMLGQDPQSSKNEPRFLLVAAHLDGGEDPGFRRLDMAARFFEGQVVPTYPKNAARARRVT
jgi:hypothetical protein